jgi:sugar lactone lactonase YvrE
MNCGPIVPRMEEQMTTDTLSAEPFLSGLFFGECPRWHEGRLWYSDFFDHAVFSASPDGERRVEVPFEGEPAGLGWLPDGRLLIASRLDRAIMRRENDGTLVRHGDLEPWATWYANDMVVASNGQAYAGNFGFDLDGLYAGTLDANQIAPTSLIRVDPDGTTHQAAADIAFPNGTVITEDGKTLVIAESIGGRLTAFDREADGTLSNRREWAALPRVAPDGICLCEDNTIWVSNALGHECIRVAEGGEVLERVTTSMNSFACMLGDDDRRTLYIITAIESHGAKARTERNGAIEMARTTVPGAGLP